MERDRSGSARGVEGPKLFLLAPYGVAGMYMVWRGSRLLREPDGTSPRFAPAFGTVYALLGAVLMIIAPIVVVLA
jgi:hypothetical protein